MLALGMATPLNLAKILAFFKYIFETMLDNFRKSFQEETLSLLYEKNVEQVLIFPGIHLQQI